jgi:hypothetical protein
VELDRDEHLIRASGTSYSMLLAALGLLVTATGVLGSDLRSGAGLAVALVVCAVAVAAIAVFSTTEVVLTARRAIEYRPLLARLARRFPRWGPIERGWRRSLELEDVTLAYASGSDLVLRDPRGHLWRLGCHDALAASRLANDVIEQQRRAVEAHKADMLAQRRARESKEALGVRVSGIAASGPARCIYCHGDIQDGDEVVQCERCATPHHDECYEVHGGCAVHACGGRRRVSA